MPAYLVVGMLVLAGEVSSYVDLHELGQRRRNDGGEECPRGRGRARVARDQTSAASDYGSDTPEIAAGRDTRHAGANGVLAY